MPLSALPGLHMIGARTSPFGSQRSPQLQPGQQPSFNNSSPPLLLQVSLPLHSSSPFQSSTHRIRPGGEPLSLSEAEESLSLTGEDPTEAMDTGESRPLSLLQLRGRR